MKLITTIEASQKLGVTDGRVRQLILAGRLPARKRGRDLWIKDTDLAAVANRPTGRPRKVERS